MTKEITKAVILQELQDKFKLREFEPASFLFDETVIPVYDIANHLRKWRSYWYERSIAAIANYEIVVIPDTERWVLRAYSPIFMSGVFTVAGVYVLRGARKDGSDFSYLDLTAGQSTSYLVTLPEPVTLEPGDRLYVNVDGYTSTGAIRVMLDYQKEEIR